MLVCRQQLFFAAISKTRRIRNSGPNRQHQALHGRIFRDVHGQLRPRTDDTHVTKKDVPELRELIEFEPAKKCTHPRDSSVAGNSDSRTFFRSVHNHRSKFYNLEGITVLANPNLTKKYWSARK